MAFSIEGSEELLKSETRHVLYLDKDLPYIIICYQLSYNDLLNMCSFHYLNYVEIYKAGRQKVKETGRNKNDC